MISLSSNYFRYFICFIAAGFFLLLSFAQPAYAQTNGQEPENYVQARLIANQTQVSGGDIIRVGLEQTIHPHWHVYWKNPGDSGTPTIINWDLPEGFAVSELQWPRPEKIPYPPLTNYGHEKQIILLQNLSIPDDIGPEPITLKASVDLLVCRDICIPESHNVSLTLNGGQTAEPEKVAAAEQQRPSFKDWESKFYKKDNNFILTIKTNNAADILAANNHIVFPEVWGAIDNAAESEIEENEDGLTFIHKAGERDFEDFDTLPVVVTYEDGGQTKAFRVIAENISGQYNQSNITPVASENSNTPPKTSIGFFQAILFALLGGLILNLMPCVFPVLSMKAISLVKLSDQEEKKARLYGLSYMAGILVSFGLIAAALLALKAGGAQIGWGFQLQSPAVITFLIYLIFTLGLNLAGFFEFSGRLSGVGHKLSQKSGNRGAFFTGILASIVATPCTAPFMGVAMGFALTQPAAVSMIVFLSLGLGLALPLLAICFIPSVRSLLPKPGVWMENFRQLLSFPMFITAAWLVWVLSQQINPVGVLCVLIGLIGIVFVIWLYRLLPSAGSKRYVGFAVLMAAIIFILSPFFMPEPIIDKQTHRSVEQNWLTFTPQTLEEALRGDHPVFTNMTAAWCITCKVNEKVALSNHKAKALFEDNKIIYLKGDWTKQDPDITHYLDSFDRQGVPLYVYYGARDPQTGKRPDPVVLPQILTFGLLSRTVQK